METRHIGAHTRKIDEEKREVTFTASTSDKDRHGTVVNQKNWQLNNYNANGIIGYQHNVYGDGLCEKATPDDVIGMGIAEVVGDELEVKIKFKPEGRSELADKVYEDVRDGFLKTVSVGFLEVGEGRMGTLNEKGETVDKDTYYFEGQELLEISVVNIPSNPKALKKQFRDSTAFALSYLHRAFDGKIKFSEIEELKVKDVIDLLSENKDDKKISDDKDDAKPDDSKDRAAKSRRRYQEFRLFKFKTEREE